MLKSISPRRLAIRTSPAALAVTLMLGGAAAILVAPGCSKSGGMLASWGSLDPDTWAHKRAKDEPIVFDLEGPISVDVETFGGDVTIEADPKAEQGSVTIVREAVHGWGRSGEAKASLADISATADVVAADVMRGELGQTLRVRTATENAEPHLQRAHVHIVAPEIESVIVRSDDGDVTITHIEGAVDVEASNGNVRIASNRAMRQPVTVLNKNGHVAYRVRGESSAEFDAQTINGRVSANVRYGTLILRPTSRDDLYQATLNDGTNKVVLRTTNGDIDIAVVPDAEGVVTLKRGPNKPPEDDKATAEN